MVVDRRKPSLGPMPSVEGKETRDDSVLILDDSSFNSEVAKLRNRWELASVLNFLIVFEPLIGTDLKLTAEDIELGLVKPNTSIAALHVKLLKGTPPMSKLLNVSDGWVTVLCKKLAVWWPWVRQIFSIGCATFMVAEGEIPLTARNGYDGNTVFGYRLYKEINRTESKSKAKGKASSTLPTVCSHWETLAVDFKEFREVVDKLLASRTAAEVAIGKTINNDVIPVVEKFQKKKERALKRKERQEMLLNDLRNSSGTEITRSCRNRRPVSYTFDEYDRAIDEAIELTKRRKTAEEQSHGQKLPRQSFALNGGSDVEGSVSQGSSDGKANSSGNSADENENLNHEDHKRDVLMGSCQSKRLAGGAIHPGIRTGNLGTKNRLRQRPMINSALEIIVSDSEDDIPSDHTA
ncbi:hypothetical protein GOBAR_DD23465 [Gossypium barbadense]|nr:hypothetical protein GOBAR_DD23465 [Gossypium barbadense]